MFVTDIRKQTFRLEGVSHTPDLLRKRVQAEDPQLSAELRAFLQEWLNEDETVSGQTSGSTGSPKVMQLDKQRMMQSAMLTCSFLGLKAGDSALLCMPLRFIGAKMIVVRALVAGLNLVWVAPSSHPLREARAVTDFAAMTPMQVRASLESPEEAERLRSIRHLIIGGGAIDASLALELKTFPHAVWSTYGMTETLSHIALRRLSGPEASDWYTPFQGVSLALSPAGTLTIHAPAVCEETLVTKDLAVLDAEHRFRITGRLDNVINSGGIKVQIETLEALLKDRLDLPFLVTALPDELLGESVVLLAEGAVQDCSCFQEGLPRYWEPRHVFQVDALPLTESGKPDRAAARRLAAAKAAEYGEKEHGHDRTA